MRRVTYVANARKGTLFLCPADGRGIIGGLLLNLSFPQNYSHMGVFIDDGRSIRHSTVVQDQMTANKHMNGSILGKPAPINGFADAAIRFGWPGTITQTVDDAFHQLPGAVSYKDSDGDKYDVTELSFTTVQSANGGLLPPIVVKPCPETTEIYDVLSVLAHAVTEINGHYRFNAYTDAGIGLDPSKAGPAMSVRKQQPNGDWVEQNTQSADPSDLCNTARVPASSSIPVVCSTLPWIATQLINSGIFRGRTSRDFGRRYRIRLDSPPVGSGCGRVVTGDPQAHVVDALTADGLVKFDKQQRKVAATWLYQALSEKVAYEAGKTVPTWLKASGYTAISVGTVLGALTTLGSAALVTAGMAAADADNLLELLTNMQVHVANQIVNAFANDDAGNATEENAWDSPGDGRSVGPEDTAWFWLGPCELDGDDVFGLYGKNELAALRRWDWVEEVQCLWKESPGPGLVWGRVFRDDGSGPAPVVGAVVEFACRKFVTDELGAVEDPNAPEGIYLVNASWTDPATGYVWESPRNQVDVQVPGSFGDIVLQAPPQEYRRVDVYGTMNLVDKRVGHDVWAHLRPSDTAFLGPYSALNPDPSARDEGKKWSPRAPYTVKVADEVTCSVELILQWNDDLSVYVTLTSQLEDDDGIQATHTDAQSIAEDSSYTFNFELDSGGLWPNKAWVNLTLVNNRQS